MFEVPVLIQGDTYTSVRATPELVGFRAEIQEIEQALADRTNSYVIHISGQGGIGKTRLVKQVLNKITGRDLLVASELIDLYHSPVHTLEGMLDSIQSVLAPRKKVFKHYQKARQRFEKHSIRRPDKLQTIDHLRDDMVKMFLQDLDDLAGDRRIVWALDTTEKLILQEDRIAEQLNVRGHSEILTWLLSVLLPRMNNMVLLLAGRPGSEAFSKVLQEVDKAKYLSIVVKGLNESETLVYFEEVIKVAETSDDPRDVPVAEIIRNLSIEDRQAIFYALCDSADPPYVRPILLALTIDYLVVAGQPFSGLIRPLAKARTLTSLERENIQNELGTALVHQLQQSMRPADEIIVSLAWLRKGADTDLLAKMTELEHSEVEQGLEQIRPLSFVKVRPADNRIFLHDEMYELLRQFLLSKFAEPMHSRVQTIVKAHYKNRIAKLEESIGNLYKAPAEFTLLPETSKVIELRLNSQDAMVEDLHYQLDWDGLSGFETYYRYAEEAIITNDENFDAQLRAELLRSVRQQGATLDFRSVHNQLNLSDIAADAAVRWVKRYVSLGQYQKALEISDQLRGNLSEIIECGGELAQAELNAWEALARAYLGELDTAETLLRDSLARLTGYNPSFRSRCILARIYNNLGYVYRLQGKHYGAIEAYRKAMPLWRHTGIKIEQANTLNNIAFAFAEVGNYVPAVASALDALHLREKMGLLLPVSYSLNTLAHIKIRENALEEAKHYAQRALALASHPEIHSMRARGLALIALAEIKRRLSDWESRSLKERVTLLDEAIEHVEEAEQIFTTSKEPAHLIESLIELGCACRSWAKLKQELSNTSGFTVDELAGRGKKALYSAAKRAEEYSLSYRTVDALVNLAWLWYYVKDRLGEEWLALDTEILPEVQRLVPKEYVITESSKASRLDTETARSEVIFPYLVQLAKWHTLQGHLAFDHFSQSDNEATGALKQALTDYTLALAYDTLVAREHVVGDMRRAFEQICNRLKALNTEELQLVYQSVDAVEQQYGLGHSRMKQLLLDHFGSHEDMQF
jgi:tetratricopeptide (TPR) repeat protein